MEPHARALTALLTLTLISATAGATTVPACPTATTLEELIVCLKDSSHLPRSATNDFVVPSLGERLDWADVVSDMLDASDDTMDPAGACAAVALPASLAGLYDVTTFTDASSGEDYCVLAEVALNGDPDKKAWGTFITSLAPARELYIDNGRGWERVSYEDAAELAA